MFGNLHDLYDSKQLCVLLWVFLTAHIMSRTEKHIWNKKYHISHGRTWQTNYYKQVALYLCNKQEQQKGSRKRKNAKGRRRKEEDKGRRRKKCKPMALTRCRDVKVLCLVDIGASRSGVKGRDEGRELALQHKLVVPCPSLSGLSNHLLILLERKHNHISFPLSDMLLYVHH